MWPGQQQPGGEQNPQDPNANPYHQPGYHQPNPYVRPGYQQQGQQGYPHPDPYPQQTVPQYPVPGQPGGPQRDEGRRTAVVAVVAATVVVATAVVTGVVVMNKRNDDGGPRAADGKQSSSASAEPSSSAANPRGDDNSAPTVPGWKVVTNPQWGTRFDVPGDWEVAGTGVFSGFENVKDPTGPPAAGFTAPAHYRSEWCVDDTDKDGTEEDTGLAGAGTKGAQGARSAAEAATNEAANWVWAAYAQEDPKSKVKTGRPAPYTTRSGISGTVVKATATGLANKDRCDTDGKSIAFTFKNAKDEYTTWVLYANAGVDDELPDATIQKILSTVRLSEGTAGPS